MKIAYPHIAEKIFGHAHAIEPVALRSIIDGPVGRRVLAGEQLEQNDGVVDRRRVIVAGAQAVSSADGQSGFLLTQDGVAIISVTGTLASRFNLIAAVCGWTTYDNLSASLQSALSDDRVGAILLDVDSPGGQVDGLLDVADEILAARAQMPIWAVANSLAASAAYAIAGSAERLYLPRLAQVGSIGAVMMHVDQSAQDEANGEKYTAIFSGARKIDGWGHSSLSPEAQAGFQERVDHVRDALAALVGRQGRMSASDALRTEAATYSDEQAVAMGLADGVRTFGDALTALTQKVAATRPQGRGGYVNGTALPDDDGMPDDPDASAPGRHLVAAANGLRSPRRLPSSRAHATRANQLRPGERCSCCGLVFKYTAEMVLKTVELCSAAGHVDLKEALRFVKVQTPIWEVERQLAQRGHTMKQLANPEPLGSDMTEEWDKTVAEINARLLGRRPE